MQNTNFMSGSICLNDIPKSEIKKIQRKDGSVGLYVNVKVVARKKVSEYGHTHFIACQVPQDKQVEGVSYIFGDLKEYDPQPAQPVTAEQIAAAPAADDTDLPF